MCHMSSCHGDAARTEVHPLDLELWGQVLGVSFMDITRNKNGVDSVGNTLTYIYIWQHNHVYIYTYVYVYIYIHGEVRKFIDLN